MHFWKARLLILNLKKEQRGAMQRLNSCSQVIYFLPSTGDPWHKWKSRSVQKKHGSYLYLNILRYIFKNILAEGGERHHCRNRLLRSFCAPCAFAFSVSAPCLPACFQWREQFRRELFGCSDDVLTRSARIIRVFR